MAGCSIRMQRRLDAVDNGLIEIRNRLSRLEQPQAKQEIEPQGNTIAKVVVHYKNGRKVQHRVGCVEPAGRWPNI